MPSTGPEKIEVRFYETLSGDRVRCRLCPHRCVIDAGRAGICGVRVNVDGRLRLHASRLGILAHADPIEKKPFYHFLPGSQCFSVGFLGCNMDCPYCINWELSQPTAAGDAVSGVSYLPPEDVVSRALAAACASVAYTYTEPVVFLEYVLETARRAKAAGLANVIKTNGFVSAEALAALIPSLDAANVDLKSYCDLMYRHWGGQLPPVLTTLRELRAAGVWIEVTTLIVPGQNDNEEELNAMARFIADELGPGTPWHILRFFPSYRMSNTCPTSLQTLERASEICSRAGLWFTYWSNVPLSGKQNTHCPECGNLVIVRARTGTFENEVGAGRCAYCYTRIPGLWELV